MMTLDAAKRAGAKAYIDGMGRAPSLNKAFTAEACASAREAGSGLVELLGAYGTGWTIAHLAAGAPQADMPSVIEFNRLMAG
ncbi:hypothetical protein HQ619_07715 [Burkholderia gladioli]|uniref:hypothetical protein n=1 Tax=Burkholderia gladioli TaxID=28095 RepID=UPI001561A3D5|nr:hypothetical protein [Burkholderia gladioli]NRF83812.1 hypothetical protein [Burkholderia gladioli]